MVYIAFLPYALFVILPFCGPWRKIGIFHPLIFFVLWFEITRDLAPKLSIYTFGLEYHPVVSAIPGASLNGVVIEGLLLKTLALLSLYVGFELIKKPVCFKISFSKPSGLIPKTMIVMAVSMFSFGLLAAEVGGVQMLLLQRGLPSDMRVASTVGGHWHFLTNVLKTSCIVWLALQPWQWKKPLFLTIFILAIVIGFLSTGSRSGVVVPVLLSLSVWMLYYRRIPYTFFPVLAIFGLAAIGLLGEIRSQTLQAYSMADIEVDLNLYSGVDEGLQEISKYSSSADGLYGILAKVPEETGHLYGYSYLSIPAAPVPRALWPEKPRAGGKLNSTLIFDNPISAIPPTNVGEAYWNFSIPGVILVMVVFGAFLKWLYCLYVVNQNETGMLAIYVVTLFVLQPNTTEFYNWIQIIVPVVLLLLFYCGFPSIRKPSYSNRHEHAVSKP